MTFLCPSKYMFKINAKGSCGYPSLLSSCRYQKFHGWWDFGIAIASPCQESTRSQLSSTRCQLIPLDFINYLKWYIMTGRLIQVYDTISFQPEWQVLESSTMVGLRQCVYRLFDSIGILMQFLDEKVDQIDKLYKALSQKAIREVFWLMIVRRSASTSPRT